MKKNRKLLLIIVQISLISTFLAGILFTRIQGAPLNALTTGTNASKDAVLTSASSTLLWAYNAGAKVGRVDISSDGQSIVTTDGNNNVTFFNRNGYVWNRTIAGIVDHVKISGNDQKIIVVFGGAALMLLNRAGGVLDTLTDSITILSSISISKDGMYFFAGYTNGNVQLYNTSSSAINLMWTWNTGNQVGTVAISADGNYMVSGSVGTGEVEYYNRTGYMWNNDTLPLVRSVAISQDGRYFVAGCDNQYIYHFDRADAGNYDWDYDLNEVVQTVDISADGNYIAAGTNDACNVSLFNGAGSLLWSVDTLAIPQVAISANGQYVVANELITNNMTLYDRNGFMWNFTATDYIGAVAISGTGEYIVAGSDNGFVYLFYNPLAGQPNLLALILGSLRAGLGDLTLSLVTILLGIVIGAGIVVIFLIMRENR